MTTTTHPESTTEPEITHLDTLEKTPHAEVFGHHAPGIVRLKLDAGQQMPPHRHPGTDIVLHLPSGEPDLILDEDTYPLSPSDLM